MIKMYSQYKALFSLQQNKVRIHTVKNVYIHSS